ncbi:uncharacterized protein [Periplaneta americana]|uniref:uncharacterized protein n=1 Tax=Periplaneta americana TaxID=6978 RepID=UPI0037E91BCF
MEDEIQMEPVLRVSDQAEVNEKDSIKTSPGQSYINTFVKKIVHGIELVPRMLSSTPPPTPSTSSSFDSECVFTPKEEGIKVKDDCLNSQDSADSASHPGTEGEMKFPSYRGTPERLTITSAKNREECERFITREKFFSTQSSPGTPNVKSDHILLKTGEIETDGTSSDKFLLKSTPSDYKSVFNVDDENYVTSEKKTQNSDDVTTSEIASVELRKAEEEEESLAISKPLEGYDGSKDEWQKNTSLLVEDDILYKILVIGDLGVGKTSIIRRYVVRNFSKEYKATVGVDYSLKVLNENGKPTIRVHLWDIGGEERFRCLTRIYYKHAQGACIVFDVRNGSTFDAVTKWKQDLDCKVTLSDGNPIPCVLLANKCDADLIGKVKYPVDMDEYCRQLGFIDWIETSAKDDINITYSFRCLIDEIQKVVARESENCAEQTEADAFTLDIGIRAEEWKKKCIC